MHCKRRLFLPVALVLCRCAIAQESHVHDAPEKLGEVSFPISCQAAVQPEFNRGVALLHSFAYAAAEAAFRGVAEKDPKCAMAHWGIAMTYFHQLWEPPIPTGSSAIAHREVEQAQHIGAGSEREQKFIAAAGMIFEDGVPYATRAANYERAMADLEAGYRQDIETQVFYALALLANASPTDKTHQKQKQAADLLEPLYASHPQHPGIAHYLIHACDNAEMAARGLPAARAYAKIAPSAPHALHMPSHIFTRLGLWEDSIASNIAARDAARRVGDTGEELHAMDYLVYAYLQLGRDSEAAKVIEQLRDALVTNHSDFKVAYASAAMPIRYLVERHRWVEAARVSPPAGVPPHVEAIAVWARGLGLARSEQAADARKSVTKLHELESELERSGNRYWAAQVGIMRREVRAWAAQAQHKGEQAVALLREAADEEDSIEKLPVTPGPIVPAREQLGELLLAQSQPELALKEFQTALLGAPGRRGSLQGAVEAAKHPALEKKATQQSRPSVDP